MGRGGWTLIIGAGSLILKVFKDVIAVLFNSAKFLRAPKQQKQICFGKQSSWAI
jgi:hypothetical protein